MKHVVIGLAAAMALLTVGTVAAHHSPIVFDQSRQIELEGTVTEFQWRNPHSWIMLEVANDAGGRDVWSIEMGSPNHLVKAGWRRTTFSVGQKVTIMAHPLRDGEKGGQFQKVIFEDGSSMTERDPLTGAGAPAGVVE